MTTAHPPGPWDLDIGEHGASISNGGTIADIDDTMTAWRADARLIAAAPDLLEACERLLGFTHHYASESAIAAGDGMFNSARAAIAKAKGV